VCGSAQVLTEYTNLAASQDAAYEHIDAEARGKVKACVDEVSAWLAGIKTTQEAAVCATSHRLCHHHLPLTPNGQGREPSCPTPPGFLDSCPGIA
jgi:hypothetical protein